jgi:hypothetical protein
MTKRYVSVLVVSLSSPFLVGVYEDKKLIKSFCSSEKTSDELPKIFDEIFSGFDVKELFFARGPGSFMAIKVTYIFLKTLSITKQIPIYATDGFYFNDNSPIKAVGSRYFMKKDDIITTEILKDNKEIKSFELPTVLDKTIFSAEIEPLYVLPAV